MGKRFTSFCLEPRFVCQKLLHVSIQVSIRCYKINKLFRAAVKDINIFNFFIITNLIHKFLVHSHKLH